MGWQRSVIVLLAAIAVAGILACSSSGDESSPEPTSPSAESASTTPPRDSATDSTPRAEPTESVVDRDIPETPTPASSGSTNSTPIVPPATPTRTSPQPEPTATQPAPGIELSPVNLPKRNLSFRAFVPNNTPTGDPVFLTVMDMAFGVSDRFRMKQVGPFEYAVDAHVLDGAMIRYTYDRFEYKDVCCLEEQTRETFGESFRLQYRFLLTEPGLSEVVDTIPMWADLRTPIEEGVVSGFVFDSTTGEPVLDADVSISGVHVGSRADGSFRVPRLPAGEHTVVVHSNTGDFTATQKTVVLEAGGTTSLNFDVTPVELVPVSFDVLLPDQTPSDAWVKLAGNLYQLGGRISHPSRPMSPDNFSIPLIERDGNNGRLEVMLPAGAFVEYFYTVGPVGISDEKVSPGHTVRRSFVVDPQGTERRDQVGQWSNDGWPIVTLRVIPPVGTPDDARIALNMGPSSWLEPDGSGAFTTVLGEAPAGGTYNYRYILGDDFHAIDASESTNDGYRTLIVPEGDSEIVEVITKWGGNPDRSQRREDGSLAVKFRVSVPPETPKDAVVVLHGNRPAIGDGVTMTRMPGDPWMYEAEVVFGHDGNLSYFFELESEGGLQTFARETFTEYDGQKINDWVVAWPGLSASTARRDGFVKGIYTPDLFSKSYIPLSESTFKRIRDHEGSAVVVSSVWSYGQSQPIPTLEYRGVHAGSVATPLEDAIAQAKIAHDAGLEVFFGPQFNMEQAPGGFEVYNEPKTIEWWTEWLKLMDEMWTWQATVAEMIEAEYMMLPGPLFHVYDHIDLPDDHELIQLIESEHERVIAKVRSLYSGKLLITGGADRYEFPGLADFNGVTTYDLGVPELPDNSTVEDFIAYYEERFVERVDPITPRWGNPVFFYTIHAPAMPTDDDPSGEIGQARALEALFQVIASRPEVIASLSWSYDMVDAPLTPSDGVRGRLGEAVLAKWYAILGGEN